MRACVDARLLLQRCSVTVRRCRCGGCCAASAAGVVVVGVDAVEVDVGVVIVVVVVVDVKEEEGDEHGVRRASSMCRYIFGAIGASAGPEVEAGGV